MAKRNPVARKLRTSKAYAPKRVPDKSKRIPRKWKHKGKEKA